MNNHSQYISSRSCREHKRFRHPLFGHLWHDVGSQREQIDPLPRSLYRNKKCGRVGQIGFTKFFVMSIYLVQWPAVNTKLLPMIEPPQRWFLLACRDTCHGASWMSISTPPTIRSSSSSCANLNACASGETNCPEFWMRENGNRGELLKVWWIFFDFQFHWGIFTEKKESKLHRKKRIFITYQIMKRSNSLIKILWTSLLVGLFHVSWSIQTIEMRRTRITFVCFGL